MRIIVNRIPHTLLAACCVLALLGGCASSKGPPNTMFDFGPAAPLVQAMGATDPQVPLPALVVIDATGPAALDTERMFYRLNYADGMQARSYANSRWSGNPLQMVTQRIKTRLSQSGVKVLSATDASAGVPLLRVEVDDFVHAFSGPARSEGQLVLRASLFQGHTLVDQKTFTRNTPAGADAAGAARALAASTDAVAADIGAWLAGLDLRKR
jgi:cholesterol transport system auxiliary component